MLNVSTVHNSSARAMARYLYQGAVGEVSVLDAAVLAAMQGWPELAQGLMGGELLQEKTYEKQDPIWIDAFGVHLRPDMTPRLEDLLGVDCEFAPDLETVTNLLANWTAGGEPIEGKRYAASRANGAEPQAFLHATFSAGKTVSIAYAFADLETKRDIRRAHQAAVETALQQIEDRIGWVRVRNAPNERGDMAWVSFFHTHSRLGDPHVHSHVAILNVVASRESERVGGFNSWALHGQFTHFREVYQRELSQNLIRLGLDVRYDHENIEAKVQDIPNELEVAFSSRQNVALETAKENVARKGLDYDTLTPREQRRELKQAVLDKRPKKDQSPDPQEWNRRLAALGWELRQGWGTRGPDLDWREGRLRI